MNEMNRVYSSKVARSTVGRASTPRSATSLSFSLKQLVTSYQILLKITTLISDFVN